MVAICTLSTLNSIKDLKVFLYTLGLFNPDKPKVYLLCDTNTANEIKGKSDIYKGIIEFDTSLDRYGDVNRKRMTAQKGMIYKTMWEDFMMEKATVMDLAFEKEESVFFFDSDICFMGPLPQIPENTKIAVSQHMIKPIDEERYGKFNAGFLWTNNKLVPNIWRQASKTSRFYDQAALEDVVANFTKEEIYNFPIQNNYGWWRMYQSVEPSVNLQKNWTMFRNEPTVGLRVDGMALLSIHTHWSEINDAVTYRFNMFVYNYLVRLGKHSAANNLCKFLLKEFPHLELK